MKTEQLHSHISYTLEDGDRLSDLGLKTLQSRPVTNCIVPGRLLVNGDCRLVYSTEEMSSVAVLLSRLTSRAALKIFADLAKVLSEFEDTAFLDKRYIDLNPEHIYISQEDEATRFIIVPVEQSEGVLYRDEAKELFGNLISKCPRSNSRVEKFTGELPGINNKDSEEYNHLTTEDIIDAIGECFSDMEDEPFDEAEEEAIIPEVSMQENEPEAAGQLPAGAIEEVELRYRGVYGAFAFFDRKEEFIIGKELTNDGILSSNPAVSRRHCKVINAGSCSFVEDMGSKNGTFVNDRIIVPGQRARLNTGDRLQIADMCFDVVIHTR